MLQQQWRCLSGQIEHNKWNSIRPHVIYHIARTSNAIWAHVHFLKRIFNNILIDELVIIIADSSERAIRVLFITTASYTCTFSSIYIHFKYSDTQMHTTTEQKKIMAPGSQQNQPPRCCCCHHTRIQFYAHIPIIFPIPLATILRYTYTNQFNTPTAAELFIGK